MSVLIELRGLAGARTYVTYDTWLLMPDAALRGSAMRFLTRKGELRHAHRALGRAS